MNTPFEQSHIRVAMTGARILESLAVNQMVVQAHVYEHEMARVGAGTPPLSETHIIRSMWTTVGQFAEGEA